MLQQQFNFSKIDPSTVVQDVTLRLEAYQQAIRALTKQENYTFDNLMLPLERLDSDFAKFYSPISHVNDVKTNTDLQNAVEEAQKILTKFETELYQNEALYKAVVSLDGDESLDAQQQRLVDKYLIEFKLSGVHLGAKQKEELVALREQLSELKDKFKKNKTQAMDAWKKVVVDEEDLAGLPDNIIAAAKKKAQELGLEGWVLTLAPGTLTAVLKHAKSRELRAEFHFADYTAASDWGPNANLYDNGPIMSKLVALKQQEAKLLGFEDHIDKSLAKKMANREDVIALQDTLTKSCRIQARSELRVLEEFARTHLGLDEIKSFDLGYVSTQYKEAKFNLDDKLISEYFPEGQVLDGMFKVVNRLFGITLQEERDFDKWDEDVKLFWVYGANGEKLGGIYMDLYARPGEKRAGAWMNECQSRLDDGRSIQLPIAFLSTNFTKSQDENPSLLTHREVQTTFHEFGHCLHHVLSNAKYPSLAGPSGVPWDAVEAPSQMMENWVWHKEGLALFSKHYKTGEPLPDHLIEALGKNRHFNAGIGMLQQLVYGTFDFNLHGIQKDLTPEEIHKLWLETYRATQVTPVDDYNHMPNTFHHIFSGSYSAGYYVYKWALNMAYDMFSEFEKNGIFDKQTGQKYLECVLQPGGIKPFMELVTNFLGRDLRKDALYQAIRADEEPEAKPPLLSQFQLKQEAKGQAEEEEEEEEEKVHSNQSKKKALI